MAPAEVQRSLLCRKKSGWGCCQLLFPGPHTEPQHQLPDRNAVVNDDSCRGQLLHVAGFWVVRGVGAAWSEG